MDGSDPNGGTVFALRYISICICSGGGVQDAHKHLNGCCGSNVDGRRYEHQETW